MMYTVWYACVCVSVCLRDAITSPTWPVTGHRFYSVTHVIIAYTDISRLWVYPPVNYHRYGTKNNMYIYIFFSSIDQGCFCFLANVIWFRCAENTMDLIGAQEVQRQPSGEVGALVLGRWARPRCHWHAGAVPWSWKTPRLWYGSWQEATILIVYLGTSWHLFL